MALNIKQIIVIFVIIAIFGVIIYFVAKTFSHQCPDGQHYDTTQKKCIINCNEDTQIYNTKTNQCRPKCTGTAVWSDSLNECKDCGIAATWDEGSMQCISVCKSDSDCTGGQYCVNNRCCAHPKCKTKEGDKCCVENNCNPDPNNTGYSLCCSELQVCDINNQTVCCGPGEICKNNTCLVSCGPEGSGIVCAQGEKCLKVQNVKVGTNVYKELSNNNKNKPEVNPDGTVNFYTCLNLDEICQSSNPFEAPSAINNFYPCFDIEKLSTDTGLGFCSYDDKKDSKATNLDVCNGLNTDYVSESNNAKVNCGKNPNCKWYDILQYNKSNINELNDVIQKTFKSYDGFYCGDKTQSLGRLFGLQFDNKSGLCSYENCVNAVANPSVTDIFYDASTGNCTSLQSCVDLGDLETGKNNSLLSILPTNCDPKQIPDCKGFAANKLVCDQNDHLIKPFGWNCNSEGTASFGTTGNCICNSDFNGPNCEFPRAPCNHHGYQTDDGKCIMDPPVNKKCHTDYTYDPDSTTGSTQWFFAGDNPAGCSRCYSETSDDCCDSDATISNFQTTGIENQTKTSPDAGYADSNSSWTCTWNNPHP